MSDSHKYTDKVAVGIALAIESDSKRKCRSCGYLTAILFVALPILTALGAIL